MLQSTFWKINFYILSLSLFFVFVIIMDLEPVVHGFLVSDWTTWWRFLRANVLSVASVAALFYCLFIIQALRFHVKGAMEIPFRITQIQNKSYEHLVFLATYIVPLISFNFAESRQLIVLALLLTIMGAIYVKTDLFYANPSLALMGFRLYMVSGVFKNDQRQDIVVIAEQRLELGERVRYIKLDDRTYFVQRSNG